MNKFYDKSTVFWLNRFIECNFSKVNTNLYVMFIYLIACLLFDSVCKNALLF